ncbi:MAG: pentapeptide repeat-containing protein [Cyclobacteriaceae bacterium]
MSRITTAILMLVAFTTAIAQQKVDASLIIKKINEGQAVSYENTIIEGDLDFNHLDNSEREHSPFDWFNANNTIESTVQKSIRFVGCTFTGDVIAYENEEWDNDTFIAHFRGDVIFQDCLFKGKAAFKYSEFARLADFSGSTFNRDVNFKYAEFSEAPTFAKVQFKDDVDFKYTEFPRGTSFERASFQGFANFKYAKFRTPLNISQIAFDGHEDFKYTEVDGRSFTSYLISKRDH